MNLREAKAGAESDSTSRIARFRSAVRTAIIVVSGTVGLLVITLMVVGAINANNRAGGSTASSVQTARTQTARKVPHCSGNGETKVVGSEWVAINPGFRCAVVFNTTDGIALLGEPNNFVEDAPGRQVGNVMRDKGIRVIFAKAKYGQARVNYMLCPHGTTSPTRWSCS